MDIKSLHTMLGGLLEMGMEPSTPIASIVKGFPQMVEEALCIEGPMQTKEGKTNQRMLALVPAQEKIKCLLESASHIQKNIPTQYPQPYDFSNTLPLTHSKTHQISETQKYSITGFVLTHEDGKKCIIDNSAVRWMDGSDFFKMMHPPT